MRLPSNIRDCTCVAVIVCGAANCGSFANDSDRYSELDRLRVLAIRAEPADLNFGETATLDALVFEPDDREVTYEWTWCPSRADASGDFKCNISEKEMKRAWEDLGIVEYAPSYDLGTKSTAQITHLLSPDLVAATCAALGAKASVSEQVVLACAAGLQPSVQLKVRTSRAEVVAVKNLALLMQDAPQAERNHNPESGFEVRVSRYEDDRVVGADQALVAGGRYVLEARLNEGDAEVFTSPEEEDREPVSGKEQLTMSWFFTVGQAVAAEGDEGFGPEDRTTFVPGASDFKAFVKNGWQLPLTAKGKAQVVLVVRDERGGVAWSEQQFDVEGK